MKQFIYLMGTDGSGKTTLAKSYLNKCNTHKKKATYLYARYFPILSQPLKLLSKLLIYRKNSEFKNFEKYSSIKSNFSSKHSLLSKIYALVCIVDYIIFTIPRFYYHYLFHSIIIVDRYVADLAVILTIASGLSESQMLRILTFLHFIFPKPTKVFFLEVDIDIAFSRKNDIPSRQYLIDRKKLYLSLKEYYNITLINGHQSKEALVDELYSLVS